MVPNSRETFKSYCLRKLGAPVIEINVDDDQVDDRIDEAIHFFWEYHFSGSEKIYYKHQVTQTDKNNKYITMPDNVIGAVNIFPTGFALGSDNLFNIRYQIALNDMYTLTNVSMVPYFMSMSHIQLLQELLVGQKPLRYNQYAKKLYIDMDWDTINVGEYLIVEAYQVVDPEEYVKAWGDRWLGRYATCLIKEQFGTNLKKFGNMQMPGGVVFNGQQIYNEAVEERKELEEEMINSYSLPASDFIG